MTTLSTLVGAITSFVKTPVARPANEDVATPQIRMAPDTRVQAAPVAQPVPSNRGLYQGTSKLAGQIAALDADVKALGQEVRSGACSAQRLQEIQLALMGLNDERALLTGIKQQADRVASNTGATASDVARMTAVVNAAAKGNLTIVREGELGQLAEDIARNVGRKDPSDRGLDRGTRHVNDQIGRLDLKIQSLAREARGGEVPAERLQQLQLEMQDLQSDKQTLTRIKQQADVVASTPEAPRAVVDSMFALLEEAGKGHLTAPAMAELSTRAEDLARQATK